VLRLTGLFQVPSKQSAIFLAIIQMVPDPPSRVLKCPLGAAWASVTLPISKGLAGLFNRHLVGGGAGLPSSSEACYSFLLRKQAKHFQNFAGSSNP